MNDTVRAKCATGMEGSSKGRNVHGARGQVIAERYRNTSEKKLKKNGNGYKKEGLINDRIYSYFMYRSNIKYNLSL